MVEEQPRLLARRPLPRQASSSLTTSVPGRTKPAMQPEAGSLHRGTLRRHGLGVPSRQQRGPFCPKAQIRICRQTAGKWQTARAAASVRTSAGMGPQAAWSDSNTSNPARSTAEWPWLCPRREVNGEVASGALPSFGVSRSGLYTSPVTQRWWSSPAGVSGVTADYQQSRRESSSAMR